MKSFLDSVIGRTVKKRIFGVKYSVIITAPIIYSLIIPLFLLDIFMSIYQAICFPIYKIPKVRRSDYFVFDRLSLDYLNGIQKMNCAYCSYGNGVIAFGREIAARSEQYWCPIKHARKIKGAHKRYPVFMDFGDGEKYREALEDIREMINKEE